MGWSVAISGNTAVVGARGAAVGGKIAQGAAYVFVLTPHGWHPLYKLVASDGMANDNFGYSVAIADGTIIVGAPYTDIIGKADQGAAYVFAFDGKSWVQQAKLFSSGGRAGDYCGFSVGVSGDAAVLGAPGADVPGTVSPTGTFVNTDQGRAYIFKRSRSAWREIGGIADSKGYLGAYDHFGYSVGVSGNRIVVGVPGDDISTVNLYDNTGSVRVYETERVIFLHKITAARDGGTVTSFGKSVSISGNRIAVGSSYLVRVFELTNTGSILTETWQQSAKLAPLIGHARGDGFGTSVAVSGNTIVVGAPNYDYGNQVDQGATYVYTLSGTAWFQQAHLVARDGRAGDEFGSSVAISGGNVLIGASADDVETKQDQGSAYVFR